MTAPQPEADAAERAALLREELLSSLEQLQAAHDELEQRTEARAESELEAELQRRRYEHLMQTAPVAYVTATGAGGVVEANRRAARLLGREPHLLVGKPLAVFIPLERR